MNALFDAITDELVEDLDAIRSLVASFSAGQSRLA